MQPNKEVKGFDSSDSESEDDDIDETNTSNQPQTQTKNNNNNSSNNSSNRRTSNTRNRNTNTNKTKTKSKTKTSDESWNRVSQKLNSTISITRAEEEKETKERVQKYTLQRKEHQLELAYNGNRALDIGQKLPKSKHNDWIQEPYLSTLNVKTAIQDKSIKIHLRKAATTLPNTEYRPSTLDACSVELANPECKVNVYATGSMNVHGVRSVASGMIGARKVAKKLRDYLGYPIKALVAPTAFGGMGNARLPFEVDIDRFSEHFTYRSTFDKELQTKFCSFKDPNKYGDNGTCHIYQDGKLRIMGLENVHLFLQWMDDMYDHCYNFRTELFEKNNNSNYENGNFINDTDEYDNLLTNDDDINNNNNNMTNNGINNINNSDNMAGNGGQMPTAPTAPTTRNRRNANTNNKRKNTRNTANMNNNNNNSNNNNSNNNKIENAASMLDSKYDYNKYDKTNHNSDIYNQHKLRIQTQYRNLYHQHQIPMHHQPGAMGAPHTMPPTMQPPTAMSGAYGNPYGNTRNPYGGYQAAPPQQPYMQAMAPVVQPMQPMQQPAYGYYPPHQQQQAAPVVAAPPIVPVVPPGTQQQHRQQSVGNPYKNPYKR